MAGPEAEAQMFDFMTLEEFDVLWDFHINAVILGANPDQPNGYYEKDPKALDDIENDEYFPQFVIRLPELEDKAELAISFLRQLEFVRREIRDGRPSLPKNDRLPRLFTQIEVDLAARKFYGLHREIVDQVINESAEPDMDENDYLSGF